MTNDPRIISAARIGFQFKVDPAIVLDADANLWLIRMACAKVIERDNKPDNQHT